MAEEFLLAPSILSADFLRLGDAIREVEAAGADWIHIDVMDGHFVPNITMGPVVVQAARRATGLPLDVHLMIAEPERYLEAFSDAGADSLTVHVEAAGHLHRTIEAIHGLGLHAGVALNPATPTGHLSEILPIVDILLVMTVNPGFSGQTFIPESLRKVEQIRGWRNAGLTRARIQVDGGITPETAPLAARAGADVFVAASAIFEHAGGISAGARAILESLAPEAMEK
ncbi:MAG: ribulose-phosphate 3-epimerase [Chloroflexota bacterium]